MKLPQGAPLLLASSIFWYNLLESDRWPDGALAEFALGLTQVLQPADSVGGAASQCGPQRRGGGVPE